MTFQTKWHLETELEKVYLETLADCKWKTAISGSIPGENCNFLIAASEASSVNKPPLILKAFDSLQQYKAISTKINTTNELSVLVKLLLHKNYIL